MSAKNTSELRTELSFLHSFSDHTLFDLEQVSQILLCQTSNSCQIYSSSLRLAKIILSSGEGKILHELDDLVIFLPKVDKTNTIVLTRSLP